jgi:hypothetical protein
MPAWKLMLLSLSGTGQALVRDAEEARFHEQSPTEGKAMRKLLTLSVIAATAAAVALLVSASTAKAVAIPCPVDDNGQCIADYDSGGAAGLDSSGSLGFDAACAGTRYNAVWHLFRGTWPYGQKIYLHSSWCGKAGAITYWSAWTSHNTDLCSGSGDYANLISGGRGYGQVTIEGGAYFSCPTTVPWLTIHKHRWMQIRFFPGGSSTAIAWG